MLSLPAKLKGILSRTAEKTWTHRLSHYKPMGIFSDFQGQLTQQSVVRTGRNSKSSELSCMSSVPASMKTVPDPRGLRGTCPPPPEETVSGHGGHLGSMTSIISTDFYFHLPKSLNKNLVINGQVISEKSKL